MFHKVKKVIPLLDNKLLIYFQNGEIKHYDVTPLFNKWKPFNALKTNKNLFNSVKIETGGYGISWNDEIDLSCEELYQNGYTLKSPV